MDYRVEDGEEYDHGIIQPIVPPMTLPLRPYLDSAVGGIELEILNLIAKVRYAAVQYTTIHYNSAIYTTLHYTALHCTAMNYTTLHYEPFFSMKLFTRFIFSNFLLLRSYILFLLSFF